MVGIKEQLFQAATVAEYLIRYCLQVAMPLVHRLDVAVAAPQWNALQHVRPPWGDMVAGATDIPALEGEGRRKRGYFVGVGPPSMSNHLLCSLDEPEQEAKIHLDTI